MLQRLYILNYALIESLDITFEQGFSVITGETGAGKSIMLGALNLLLGGRADAKSIKTGAQKCCVEATFDVSKLQLQDFFAEADIDFDGAECILRREVSSSGKSRAFVNDTPVQVATLRRLGASLIDIHSQHRNLLLGEEHFLLETLDTIGNCTELAANYRRDFSAWTSAKKDLLQLREKADRAAADADYLQHKLAQLDAAALQPGEQEELEQESETLSHAEEIKGAFFAAKNALSGEECNPSLAIRNAIHALENISSVYAGTEALTERLNSMRIELDDIADEVERTADDLEFDPARLSYVEERLDSIYSLEKKLQADSIEELLQKGEEMREELERMVHIDSLIAEREQQVEQFKEALLHSGQALHTARQEAGKNICKTLCHTLASLGMPSACLDFSFAPHPQPEASGPDAVSLLFSGNKNVPPRDVAEIASGGEIARLMLALKALVAQHRQLPTIVFDEIDTGVSGTMAEQMAQVMQQMAAHCQVLCITHLPQIAALGKHHYRVYKSEDDTTTTSHIDLLDSEARIREIANMLSGAKITQAAIDNAKSLLQMA